jgi:hypothetical protein
VPLKKRKPNYWIAHLRLRLRLISRPTVSRLVHLGVGHQFGAHDLILIFLCLVFGSYFFVLHIGCPLWWEDWSVVWSAITHWSESCRTHNYTLLSRLRLPHLGGPGPRIYIPQKQGGPVIPLGTRFPFLHLLQLTGLRWRYSNAPPHENSPFKYIEVEVGFVTDGQSANSSWCRAPLWCPWPDFNVLIFDNYFLCSSSRAPSLTRGGVCSLHCKHSLVLVAQNSYPYITVSSETPPTWMARSVHLCPTGTGWPSYTPGHWVPFSSPLMTRRATSNPPPHGKLKYN